MFVMLFTLLLPPPVSPSPQDVIARFVEQRRSLGNYKLHMKSTMRKEKPLGTITHQEIESQWEVVGNKYYQKYNVKTIGRDKILDMTICKVCTSDGRNYFNHGPLCPDVMYCSIPPYSPHEFSFPLNIGLSDMGAINDTECLFDFYLRSELYHEWKFVDNGANSGVIKLSRDSVSGSMVTTISVNANKPYQLYSAEFKYPEGYGKVLSHYSSPQALFPDRVEIDTNNIIRKRIEKIEIVKAEFHLPASAFDFNPTKAGLRRGMIIIVNQDPTSKVRHEGGYWDGSTYPLLVPNLVHTSSPASLLMGYPHPQS